MPHDAASDIAATGLRSTCSWRPTIHRLPSVRDAPYRLRKLDSVGELSTRPQRLVFRAQSMEMSRFSDPQKSLRFAPTTWWGWGDFEPEPFFAPPAKMSIVRPWRSASLNVRNQAPLRAGVAVDVALGRFDRPVPREQLHVA